LSRRIGRSQNGVAGGSSGPLDREPPPESAGSAGGLGAGFGRARPADRWRGPALGQPLAGQAGPPPLDPPELDPPELDPPELDPPELDPPELDPRAPELDGRGAGRLTGGADPPPRLWLLTGERPAPRDQPEADADAGPPDPFGPPAPVAPCRGGRSSGGATRLLPPSASVTFLARAEPGPGTPPTTRRELPLASSSPSAGGGASGRSRDA
jgi:hypothetical protein